MKKLNQLYLGVNAAPALRQVEDQNLIPCKSSSVGVNSTQNIKRTSSKDSATLNRSSYYLGGAPNQKINMQSKSIISPVKKQGKKQQLIQTILNQDLNSKQGNGKYFLNLTLQQIIQQQIGNTSSNQVSQNQKRLNKTLDNAAVSAASEHQVYQQPQVMNDNKVRVKTNYGTSQENVINRGKSSNQITSHNYNQVVQQQKQSMSTKKSKFSSTMRVSDFNQTQQFTEFNQPQTANNNLFSENLPSTTTQAAPNTTVFDSNNNQFLIMNNRGIIGSNSLKNTQNLNLQNIQNEKVSIYSSNMAQSTTNYQQNVAIKAANAKKAKVQQQQVSSQNSNTDANSVLKGGQTISKQQLSQHRKQSSQGDNDRDMLKKIMNFYQDDFLTHFNLKNAKDKLHPQLFNNNRMSLNLLSSDTLALNGNSNPALNSNKNLSSSNKMSYSASKIGKYQTNKHKANTTLNQYLQANKSNTAMNVHKQPLMYNEPQVITAGPEESSQLINPYNQLVKQNNIRKNSTQGVPINNSNGVLFSGNVIIQREAQSATKEFQNKTQPIPKSVLELAAQIGIAQPAANLSTGASMMCGINGPIRAPSRDSLGKSINNNQLSNTQQQPFHAKRQSKSRTKQTGTYPQQQQQQIQQPPSRQGSQPKTVQNNQPQQQLQQPQQLSKKAQSHQKKQTMKQIDDPADVYKNKRALILDDRAKTNSEYLRQDEAELEDMEVESSSSDGNTKLSRYILGKQIGQGAYAVVRVATVKKDNSKVAIKVYDKSKLTDTNRQRSVRREIKLLQKMNHPNIVKIYEAFETDDNVYLVMEYVGGGSLHSYLREKPDRRLEEDDARRIFKQILTALQYCHRKSIAHRDIKLENILLDSESNVKLIDFGFSTCIPNDKKIKMFCGTPSYMGPEIVMKEEYAGPPADIWASAVLLYALLNGCFPFRGATDKELYRRIQRGTFALHNPLVSDAFLDILTRMLNTIANDRPSADDLLDDPWFKITLPIAPKTHEEIIADQKRQFKAKILGKIPVEKDKNTIYLNSSQEKIKNKIRNSAQQQQLSDPINNKQENIVANEFSDYGIQQQNVMKRLNQEAYQAYYNTSGANYGASGSATIQNPYYNNFFQNNNGNTGNQQNNQQNIGSNYYPNTFQARISPSKSGSNQNGNQFNQNYQLNNQQNPNIIVGTPQVFGSPTGSAFQVSGGLINNNFNIINNIILGHHQDAQQYQQLNQDQQVNHGATHGANLAQSMQPHHYNGQSLIEPVNIMSPPNEIQIPQVGVMEQTNDNDIDEDILDSITQLGYSRQHVMSQLLNMTQENGSTSQINKLYNRLKEEKLSKTQNNRAHSHQPNNGRRPQQLLVNHNYGIYPNFMPPDENNSSGSQLKNDLLDQLNQTQQLDGLKNAYADDINDDYNLIVSGGHLNNKLSPKVNSMMRYSSKQ